MRHGQATILMLAVLLPVSLLGLLGLAYVGARVQGERAQRFADTAALRAAQGLPVTAESGVLVEVRARGGQIRATAHLPGTTLDALSVFGVDFTGRASAVARTVTTSDGGAGAVLVG